MFMIALTFFIVVTYQAFSCHDINKSIFQSVRSLCDSCRQLPDDHLDHSISVRSLFAKYAMGFHIYIVSGQYIAMKAIYKNLPKYVPVQSCVSCVISKIDRGCERQVMAHNCPLSLTISYLKPALGAFTVYQVSELRQPIAIAPQWHPLTNQRHNPIQRNNHHWIFY